MQPSTPGKYRPFPQVQLANRTWPDKVIDKAPVWLSTDLRDGNQALFEPLDPAAKMRLFELLVSVGFKEIEVAFPAASQTDFDFVRALIEGGRIPEDVTISVLSQCREHLIRRTMESLAGAKRAIVHIYASTAPAFLTTVFKKTKEEVIEMTLESVRLIKELAAKQPETEWALEFSPENFSGSELSFARDISDAVAEAWGAAPDNKLILNLPATVELATPNVFADQIEWMCRELKHRDSMIISVHTHNDRGSAVAAAELAVLAGAERIEGCLFGNGERTGNADLVTMALNLFSQGMDPGLDFSQLDRVARTAEELTGLPVHPRHPYAGDLVFTAFSGSHQDAIKKGMAARKPEDHWNVPYLPVDPEDLGRGYDSIVRVNSQSGKGGVSYIMETAHGLVMPRRLQVEFSGAVQRHADSKGGEISPAELWDLFGQEYLKLKKPILYAGHHLIERGKGQGITLTVRLDKQTLGLSGKGNGPIAAAVNALGLPVELHSYEERSIGRGADAKAAAFIEMSMDGVKGITFGVGIHENIITASILSVISVVNRLLSQAPREVRAEMLEKLKEE
ncbi:MAG: 2-isopropylmalate synthase, partial [Thermodesulfobacteriota bacterium]